MHTGYTLIQPYVFLTLNSLLTNEHLLSSPADLFCYEFSGDVSLKFVASPYTELIIGQRPDGSCRIFCIRTADEPFHTGKQPRTGNQQETDVRRTGAGVSGK